MLSHRGETIVFAVAVVLCMLGTAWAMWAGGVVMTNDGPHHALGAMAWASFEPGSVPYSHLQGRATPVTGGIAFERLLLLLEPMLGWQDAYRAALVLVAELWGIAWLALLLTGPRARRVLGLLGFPCAFQLSFFLGVSNSCWEARSVFWPWQRTPL